MQLTQFTHSFHFTPGIWMIESLLGQNRQLFSHSIFFFLNSLHGPPLSLVINTCKCELFSIRELGGFTDEMKKSNTLNFEILGVPIGEPIFCAKSIAEKRANASRFLPLLNEVYM